MKALSVSRTWRESTWTPPQSAGDESGGHDLAGQHLAERGDIVVGARSDFADRANAAQQFVEGFKRQRRGRRETR